MRTLSVYRRWKIWRALLLDGSVVVARRYGLSLAAAMRRGIEANLAAGARDLKITGIVED